MRLSIRPVLSVVALSLASAGLAQAAPYTITNLGTLGGKQSYAAALNADGLVVGHSSGPQKAGQTDSSKLEFYALPFLHNGSTMAKLGEPGHLGLIRNKGSDGVFTEVIPNTFALSLNAAGVVVGYGAVDTDSADDKELLRDRPFAYIGGQMINLGLPPATGLPAGVVHDSAVAEAVNDNNLVVGRARMRVVTGTDSANNPVSSLTDRAFVYNLGTQQWTILPVADNDPNRGAYGLAINNSGVVTGSFGKVIDDVAYTRAYRWNPGDATLTDLGGFSGKTSYPHDINASGMVVGFGQTTDYDTTTGVAIRQGFLSMPGSAELVNLGYLSSVKKTSEAFGINDAGQIVGEAGVDTLLSSGSFVDLNHAFLSQVESGARVMRDLNAMLSCEDQKKWVLHRAVDINNKGQIAGFGTVDGEVRAFLLSPPAGETAGTVQSCPAPEVPGGSGGGGGSLGLGLAALLAGLGLMRRR